ncbi:unnamed protein product [Malus baccata var. baccata]
MAKTKLFAYVVVAVVSPFPPSDMIGINSVQREISFYYLFVPYSTIYDFYQLFKEDELEQSTEVPIMFPGEPKLVYCEFDWELDELEEFTDNLIEEEELSADQKNEFKEFVKEKARETRRKAIEEMSEEAKTAFENMRFYKFYPVHTPDTPDISIVKEVKSGSGKVITLSSKGRVSTAVIVDSDVIW